MRKEKEFFKTPEWIDEFYFRLNIKFLRNKKKTFWCGNEFVVEKYSAFNNVNSITN